ncbi:programmed cell death 6-interacting protein-like [Planococcus citri]|uniref:programmed cell death 6-interacting protein-like n=1 Tax=Planococcus citri TaxID=170843 RepID=UPI0031F90B2B
MFDSMSEFLSIPPKKPTDVDLVKPLKNIISSHYSTSDNPDSYNNAIEEFNKLRSQAIWKVYEKYESSLEVAYCYYDELVSLETKLSGSSPQIAFKWKDAFDKGSLFTGRASLTLTSFKYECICVLFNIGALQSSVAATQSVESDDGLKLAAKLFQLAAGIYKHIKETVQESFQQDLTPDLNTETLSVLTYLMLAQAQEIFALKAIHDQMKDAVIAKLCAQCEEYYTDTARLMQKDFVRPLVGASWISLVVGKCHIFRGLAEYFQSLVCKSKKEVGEEIARLQASIDMIKSGQQQSAKNLFQDYLNKAQRALAEAQKDNDFIYHERIPDLKALDPIPRAAIAKPTTMPQRLSANFTDLFSDLTPVVIHQALAAYDVRRTELMNSEVNKLRESTQLLNSVLASLNLPAALEDTNGVVVPPSVIEKSEIVMREGGVQQIEQMIRELPDLLRCNQEILDETEKQLIEEKLADDTLRAQFREKWTRTESDKLTGSIKSNLDSYKQMIQTAQNADSVVREKFEQHKRAIKLLAAGRAEIERNIPAGSTTGGSSISYSSSAISSLKRLMEEVETIKAERDAIESELKSATVDMKSTFLQALAHDGAINEAELSKESLNQTYAALQKQVKESIDKQESLLANIQNQNTEFCKEKSNCVASIHRETFLKELAAAYDAYVELKKNLQEGINFYKNLTQHLVTFQNKVTDFCFARKTEKEELMRQLTQDASRMANAPPAPTPPATGGADAKKEPPPRPPAPNVGNVMDGSKTLPYPVYPHGMPMPYAVPPGYAYAPPPMPTTYNPYATLPHMHSYPPPPQQPQYPQQQYNTFPYYRQQ